ncbi:MAG: D-tyrosyl-tRNA(Tyr) deacylase [Desulfuromonadales bacterium]|nr:D-tyrosyl-tRNA(Tyr) deacylase [Desulfuromonadales bacterium]
MRAVVQRVTQAGVTVAGKRVADIAIGLLVLIGIEQGDDHKDAAYLAEKIAGLRIFEDAAGKMNLSVAAIQGEVLVVSQFTLLADCRKGRRPGFSHAAPPELAEPLCDHVVALLKGSGVKVQTGVFRADMAVDLVNDGPVTMLIDSRKLL